MAKIAVDKLEPGMKLAKPVENASGMVLIGEGAELTMETIDRIRNLEVDGVYIQGMTKPSTPVEEMKSELDRRFQNVIDQPNMDMLKRVLLRHIESLYE